MPSSSGSSMRPKDVINHMFICTRNYRDNYNNDIVLLGINEVGVIRDWKSGSNVCKVEVTSRRPTATLNVPIADIKLGPPKLLGPLPVDFQGALSTPITTLSRPAPSTSTNDMRNHCAAILTGISESSSRLPKLDDNQYAWLESKQKVEEASNIFNSGILQCSRKLVGVLVRQDFTIRDVIRACLAVKPNNHTCGIYLRVYSNFKPGPYHGHDPYIYIGQTIDMSARKTSHRNDSGNPKRDCYGGTHYTVARAANDWTVVQLAEFPSIVGGSQEAGTGLRDISEQLFVLFLGSYHPQVLSSRDTLEEESLEQAISEYLECKDLASKYRDIARMALGKTGFALPGKPNRQKAFGIHSGLNKQSPLNSRDRYEKLLWTVQDAGDRWIMHRSSLKLPKKRIVCAISDKSRDGVNIAARSVGDDPAEGDDVFTSVEVMKPSAGEHPVPWYRCPNIGPWNNWHYANKVALKYCWKSQIDGQWRVQYVQALNLELTIDDTEPGCSRPYAYGVALYAFFTKNYWEDKPEFVPNFGIADLLVTRVDHFNQEIQTKLAVGPLCTLPKVEFSLEVARQKLRNLGYEHVDGPWKSLDFTWTSDTQYWASGVQEISKGGNWTARKACDRCHVYQRNAPQHKCVRIGDSNRCQSCRLVGIPCSWTKLPKLYGQYTWRTSGNKKIVLADPTYQKTASDLIYQPIATQALLPQVIEDPGFAAITI